MENQNVDAAIERSRQEVSQLSTGLIFEPLAVTIVTPKINFRARAQELLTEVNALRRAFWSDAQSRGYARNRLNEILQEVSVSDYDGLPNANEARDKAEVLLEFSEIFKRRVDTVQSRLNELKGQTFGNKPARRRLVTELEGLLETLGTNSDDPQYVPDWFLLDSAGRTRAALQALIDQQNTLIRFL